MRRLLILTGCCGFLAASLVSGSAFAQLSNKPFSFRSSGIGMSQAARQAIINQKLFGETPKIILRGDSGELLTVNRGPGRSAIVTNEAGVVVPRYRGRQRIASLGAGVHNGYFAGDNSSNTSFGSYSSSSSQTIDSWTSRVIYGRPSYGGNSVDQWTSMVASGY